MLVLLISSLMILIFLSSLHYHQHFRLRCKNTKIPRKILPATPSSPYKSRDTVDMAIMDAQMAAIKRSYRKAKCCCTLTTIDGEDFDFFPISFLFYLLFMLTLCIMIIIIVIINYIYSANNENITALLFGYTIKSYHNNSFSKLHDIKNTIDHNRYTTYTIDYILIYGILILAIWESLFSYYRYFTTFIATQKFSAVSTKTVMKRFSFYALIFIILFVIEIHLYYYIFSLTILSYCIFNCYCTYKFAMMLIERYKMFIDMEDNIGYQTGANQDILNSVIFMKNTSLICCILQSVYLSLFLFFYNITIIYYLPILWAISSFISTINFVRNRRYFQHQHIRAKQYFKCICYKKVKANLNKTVHRLSLAPIASRMRRVSKSQQEKTEKIISEKDNLDLPPTNTKLVNMSASDPNIQLVSDNKYTQFNQLLASKLHELKPDKLSLSLAAHSADIERYKNTKKHLRKKTNTVPLSMDYPCTQSELVQNYSEPMDAPFKINLNAVKSNPVISLEEKHAIDSDNISNRGRSRSNASGVSSKRVSFVLPNNKRLTDKQHSNGSTRSCKKHSNTSSKRVSFALPNMHENIEVDTLMVGGGGYLDLDDELMMHEHGSNRSSMRPNKALQLLGINEGGSAMTSPMHSPNRSRKFGFNSPKSKKDGTTGSRTPTFGGLPGFVVKLSNKLSQSKSKSTMKKSWFVNVVSVENDDDDDDDDQEDVLSMNTDDLNTPLPDELKLNNIASFEELNAPSRGNKTDTDVDEDDGFEFVFGDGDDYMADDIKNGYDKTQINTIANRMNTVPNSRLVNHTQSTSAPAITIDKMVESFDILAKYGFCSRKSINSIKQLTKYKNNFKHSKNLSTIQNGNYGIDEDNEVDEVGNTTVPFGKFMSTPVHSNRL